MDSGIFEDTTWTLEGSPYRVIIPDVVVFQDLTLTIDPGVEVIFDTFGKLTIRGHLEAMGSDAMPISFHPSAENQSNTWKTIVIDTVLGASLNLQHAELSNAETAITTTCCNAGGPLMIQDTVFRQNRTALAGSGPRLIVKRSLFDNNDYAVTGANKAIYDSTFINNEYGLYETDWVDVTHSTFRDNASAALYGGGGVVENSLIENNSTGIKGLKRGFTVSHSVIRNNDVGIVMTEYDAYREPVSYNTIVGNTAWNVQVLGTSNAHLENNWWGMTDEDAIQETIEDGRDNGVSGLAIIDPFQLYPTNIEPAPRVGGNGASSPSGVLGETVALRMRGGLR